MRRRGRSKTRYSESTNAGQGTESEEEPMDEDDQIELVEALELEVAEQTRYFQMAFGYGIGGMAIFVSLIFPLLCQDECYVDRQTTIACWTHSVLSSLVHAWTVYPFALQRNQRPRPIAIDGTLQLIPILMWWFGFFHNDEEQFHLALLIGNLVTFSGARLMYWDIESTKRSLQSLDAARYRHKSL